MTQSCRCRRQRRRIWTRSCCGRPGESWPRAISRRRHCWRLPSNEKYGVLGRRRGKLSSPRPSQEKHVIFRQLFDATSGTYTYLLASRRGGEALIIDPVLEKVDRYLQLIRELDLKLVKAVDTHLHADHITGLGALRDRTHCITVMGEQTKADVV